MEIRDPVHGSIQIEDCLVDLIEHPFFRRLRGIKQLGLSEYVFPGATHTRFLHSIGVMAVATQAFQSTFKKRKVDSELERLRMTLKLACLLHDVGHAPLSHSTESVMPQVFDLKLPKFFTPSKNRQATHEDYTIKAIVDGPLTQAFAQVHSLYGVRPEDVAALICGKCSDESAFIVNGHSHFPLLHQLVSGELDCDRMDYLLRDSYFCGVSYGQFDLDWLLDNFHPCLQNDKYYLGISQRAVPTFDDFLLSRYHMFLMVYFHYKSVCLEKLLERFFETTQEYSIPADIELYQQHDDHYLTKILKKSSNTYAKLIVANKLPQKVYESFDSTQRNILDQIEIYLHKKGIETIRCSSQGRLSKYYREDLPKTEPPLKVVHFHSPGKDGHYKNINEATDLFSRYSQAHSVSRLHCWEEDLDENDLKVIEELKQSELSNGQ